MMTSQTMFFFFGLTRGGTGLSYAEDVHETTLRVFCDDGNTLMSVFFPDTIDASRAHLAYSLASADG
ncbi:unnamed protein product [Diplocarpon coronariae]